MKTFHVRALLADKRDIAGTVILIQGIIKGPRGQSNGTYSQNSAQPERSRQGAEAAPSQEQRRSEPKAGPICDEPPPAPPGRGQKMSYYLVFVPESGRTLFFLKKKEYSN